MNVWHMWWAAVAAAGAMVVASSASGAWTEDFDAYNTVDPLPDQSAWVPWENDPWRRDFYATTAVARSSPNSCEIDGEDDAVYEFTDVNSGVWRLSAWVYVPAALDTDSYFVLTNTYPVDTSQTHWSLQLRLDPFLNVVESEYGGERVQLVADDWSQILVYIDFDIDQMTVFYDHEHLVTKPWTAGPNDTGGGALDLAAVDLWGNDSPVAVYYDDMELRPGYFPTYVQPVDCTTTPYLSNINNQTNPTRRHDDFVCTETSDITHVVFWGSNRDMDGCGIMDNLSGFEINFYAFDPNGPFGWEVGDLLWSAVVPPAALDYQFECWTTEQRPIYRINAPLTTPFRQDAGQHYALRIAGVDINHVDPCLFRWANTTGYVGSESYIITKFNPYRTCTADAAFGFVTEPPFVPSGDVTGDGVVNTDDFLAVLSNWGDCPEPCPPSCAADVTDDCLVNTDDFLMVLSGWTP